MVINFLIFILAFIAGATLVWVLQQRLVAGVQHGHEYRVVLDTLEDAILVSDLEGQSIYMNLVARKWFMMDEAESYDTHPLHALISPLDDFLALRAHGGRASLRIGGRHVEAVAQPIEIQGQRQVTVVLHDVTTTQALLAEERRRVRELVMFNEINQVINNVGLQLN